MVLRVVDGRTSLEEEDGTATRRRETMEAAAGLESDNTVGEERYEKARQEVLQTQLRDATRTLLCAKGAIIVSTILLSSAAT